MRKIYIILASFVLAGFMVSCEDFLDQQDPNKQSSDTFWQTEKDLLDGLNAAYRPLRFTGTYGRWYHVLYVSRADEGYSISPNTTFVSYSNFRTENHAGCEGVRFPWLDTYKGIFWANQVIYAAENQVVMSDEALRQRILGEAIFLRGLHYFNLAGIFGRGPLTLSPMAEEVAPIVEQDALYEQARKDFLVASEEGRLPVVYPNAGQDLGRITRGAALGMLAKVYAQERNWEEMEKVCKEVIDLKTSGGAAVYSLVGDYASNFTRAGEFNSESVFELAVMDGYDNGVVLGHDRTKFLGFPAAYGAYDDATPRLWLRTELQRERVPTGSTGAYDPRLGTTLYYEPTSSELIYGSTWSTWGASASRVYWRKYTEPQVLEQETHSCGNNIRIIRLADIYLMYAEALNENGKTPQAYEYINYVRNRVGLSDLENSTVFNVNTQAEMREHIKHERICELTSEGWRWLDLERWGVFEDQDEIDYIATNRDAEFSNFVIGKSNRFPIPVRELPLVDGLEQNPGY